MKDTELFKEVLKETLSQKQNTVKLFEEIISENEDIKNTKKNLNMSLIYMNSFFMKDVFRNMTLDEAEESLDFKAERDLINNLILSKKLNFDPEIFFNSLEEAHKKISKKGIKYNRNLVKSGLNFLKSENIKTYKLEGFEIGFALKKKDDKFSEIIAMFNATNHSGIGYLLIESAISLGGNYLECYSEELMKKVYRQSGFEVIEMIPNVNLQDRSGDKETVYRMKLGSRKKEYT